MEKYAGREEELIKKLDLRYRRKRMKSVTRQPGAQNPDGGNKGREEKPPETAGGVVDGGGGEREEKLGRRPPPQSTSEAKASADHGDDDFRPIAVIETRVLSPPKKLTFIKVEKASSAPNKSRGAVAHGWDKGEGTDGLDLVRHDAAGAGVWDGGKDGDDQDESAMPPKITKKGLHNSAISDSTKTAVHANRGGCMEEVDANPGMIPLPPSVNVNSPNLGNQVEIERMDLEEKRRSCDASGASAGDGGNNKYGKGVVHHDDDDQDEIMMPPKITKKGLPRSISDSTQKTTVRANRVGLMEEVDANPGMIPYTPGKNVNSTNMESQVENECTELEEKRRQLAEKRIQLEKKMPANKKIEEEKEVKSPQSASAKSPQSASAMSSESAQDKLEKIILSPPNLGYDYKLRRITSKSSYTSKAFDDGISVMTMETKATLPLRATHRVGDGDAIYSFDEMLKRPPNSIIVESSGSGSDGINVDKPQTTTISKLQRVIPEIETEDEKAKLAEASSEAAAKLDNVEARIRARYRLMEEEAAKKNQTGTLMETHDELSDMESMFREAKSKSSLQVDYSEQDEGKEEDEVDKGTAMETAEVEKKEEIAVADEQIIQSILSSYDEEDQSLCASVVNAHPGPRKEDTDLQIITSSYALDDMGTRQVPMKTFSADVSPPSLDKGGDSIVSAMSQHSTSMMAIAVATRTELKRLREVAAFNQQQQGDATIYSGSHIGDIQEEEITRLIAEKESRFQAEQAVALLKAQRELEAERRARLEAETAKMRAEIELEHLKREKIMRKEEDKLADKGGDGDTDQEQVGDVAAAAPLEPSEEKPSSDSPAPFLGQNQLGFEKRKLEVVVTAVDPPRVKAEEQLESVNTDEMAKEDEVIEQLRIFSRAVAQQEQPLPDAIDQSRLEAEATRLQAEKELELLRAKRAAALTLEYDEMAQDFDVPQDPTENKLDLSRTNSEQDADDIEKFRHVYSSDDDSVSRHSEAVVDEALHYLSEEDENRRKFNDMLERVISKSSSDESEGIEVAEPAQIGKSETSSVASDVAERTDPQMKSLSLENEIVEATGQESSSEALGQESTSPRKDTLHVAAQKDESFGEVVESNERDFPLGKSKPAVPKETDEEVEAVIHHVAVVTFEGNPGKGQLSFITGSKIEAHSNQRGPWWLGRCGTRTGWFPARAVVPESEFLARFNSPSAAVVDYDESEEEAQLSGDELHAVYDLIRNPSDQSEQYRDGDDSSSESGSPARSRWLDTGADKSNTAFSSSRDHSPPPTRSDPSEMAGLMERLYESNDDDSRSKTNEGRSPSPISSMPDDMSKIDPKDAPEPLSNTPSDGAAKELQPSVDAPKPKPKGDWRAVRDPNSGLIYYYHVITKETTWEKPPGFVSRQATAERKSPKAASREKSKSRKGIGIINFLTKITKPTSPAPTKASGKPSSPAVSSPSDGEKFDSSVEAKHDATTRDRTSAKSEKLEVDDLGEIEQKGSWLTLDDKAAESDDDSESSEDTYASITKRKIKSVRKWAGKITEKLNSPPSQPYKKWDDGTEEPKHSAVSSAKDQLKESPSVRSIDEPPQKQKDPEQPIQSEGGDVVDREGQLATEEEPKEQVTQDSIDAEDAPTFKSSDTDVVQADPPVLVVNTPITTSRKQPDWRSAIDHATGRTYYYIRGTSKVTWERPSEMSDR